MAPPQLRQQTSNCSLLLIYRPRRDERLSWPGWLTYSGWYTRTSGHPSATGRAQDSESSLAKDRRYTAGPRNQPGTMAGGGRGVRTPHRRPVAFVVYNPADAVTLCGRWRSRCYPDALEFLDHVDENSWRRPCLCHQTSNSLFLIQSLEFHEMKSIF